MVHFCCRAVRNGFMVQKHTSQPPTTPATARNSLRPCAPPSHCGALLRFGSRILCVMHSIVSVWAPTVIGDTGAGHGLVANFTYTGGGGGGSESKKKV